MKNLLSTVLLLGTLSTQAFAQTAPIQDPKNILGELDSFVDARSFKDEFKVFDYVELESKECVIYDDYMNCDSETELKQIKEVTSDYALLQDNMAILKSTYEKYDRNPVRFWLSQNKNKITNTLSTTGLVNKSADQGAFVIDSITYGSFDLDGAHNAARVDFVFKFLSDDGSEIIIPLYIIVSKDLPFLGQIAEMGLEMEINGQTLPPMMKVVDYSKR